MIQTVIVTNHLNESLELELGSPEKSGLLIKSITGLGSAKADINITNLASLDGGRFNSAQYNSRNVVLNLYYYGVDIEESRRKTYKYFPTKHLITLTIKTDYQEAQLSGYVEKNETSIFDEKSGCQISLICPDPFIYSKNTALTSLSGIDPVFEFPWEDDIENPDDIEFSQIRIIKNRSVYYTGEAEVGVTISVHALGPINDLTIYNLDTAEKIYIDNDILTQITTYKTATGQIIEGSGIVKRDDIIISTVSGNKSAVLIRKGKRFNIINALGQNTDWFKLSKGDNIFTYSASLGEYDAQISIKNRIAYMGV